MDGQIQYDLVVDSKTGTLSGVMKEASNLDKSMGKLKGSLLGIGKVSAKVFAGMMAAATAGIGGVIKIGMDYNNQMETYTTNFATMLGSQEAAVQKVNELKELAAKTPLEMTDLANGTQTLLSFGVASEKTTEAMRQIGDVALGDANKVKMLSLAYGQVQSAGKLMGQDLLQMINAGFNPLQVISEKTGKSMATLKEEMAAGKISADMVADAFATATSEGGKFYKGMENASKTFEGLKSTLSDNARALAGDVTASLQQMAKETALPQLIKYVDQLQTAFNQGGVEGLISEAGDVIGDVLVKFAEATPQIAEMATKLITSIGQSLQDNAPALETAVSSIVAALSSAFSAFLPVFIDIGVKAISSLGSALVQNIPNIISSFVDGFASADIGGKIGMTIVASFMAFNIASKLAPVISSIKTALTGLTAVAAPGGAAAAGGGITAFLTGLANGLKAFANPQVLLGAAALAGVMVILAGGAWASIKIISNALPDLSAALAGFNNIDGGNLVLVGAGLAALGVGLVAITAGSIIDGLAKFVGGGFENALKGIIEPIAALMPKIDAGQIGKFAALGQGLMLLGVGYMKLKGATGGDTIATSITSINTAISTAATGSANYTTLNASLLALSAGFLKISTTKVNVSNITTAVTTLTNSLNKLKSINVSSIGSSINSTMSSLGAKITISVANGIKPAQITAKLRAAILAAAGQAKTVNTTSVGTNIIAGIVSGINSSKGSVAITLLGAIQASVSEVKKYLGIKSPSRLFIKIFGYVVDGAVLGITRNTSNLVKAGIEQATAYVNAVKKIINKGNKEIIIQNNNLVTLKNAKAKALAQATTEEEKEYIRKEYDARIAETIKQGKRLIEEKNRLDQYESKQNKLQSRIDAIEKLKNNKKAWKKLSKKKKQQLLKELSDAKNQLKVNEINYDINEELIKNQEKAEDDMLDILEDAKDKSKKIQEDRLKDNQEIADAQKKIQQQTINDTESMIREIIQKQKNLGINPNVSASTKSVGTIIVNATTNGVDAASVSNEIADIVIDKVNLGLGGV